MGHQQRMKLLNEQEMFKRLAFKRGAAEAASGEQAAGPAGPTVPALRRDERAVKSSGKHTSARDSADAPRPPPPPPARAPASETESTLSERPAAPPQPSAKTAAAASRGASSTAAAAAAASGSASGREARKRAGEKQRAEVPVVEPLRLPVDSDVTHTARTVDTAREPSSRKSAHSHSRSTLPEQVSTAREVRSYM